MGEDTNVLLSSSDVATFGESAVTVSDVPGDSVADEEEESLPVAKRPRTKLVGAAQDRVSSTNALALLVQNAAYNPSQDPLRTWSEGSDVPYSFLCDALADVSNTSSRLSTVLRLANCFWCILSWSPQDLLAAAFLALNKLAADQEGLELGVGDVILMKAISEACCKTSPYIKEQYTRFGDLAEVAQTAKSGQKLLMKPKPLRISQVYQQFCAIAKESGKDAQKQRTSRIVALLRDATSIETNFLVRALQGKMRIGLAESSVLCAIAYAFVFQESSWLTLSVDALQSLLTKTAEALRCAYHEVPSLPVLIEKVRTQGLAALAPGAITLTPGVAVKPMLAHPLNGVSTILDRFEDREFTCEYKYDGERAQIHYDRQRYANSALNSSSELYIFSRNSENNTGKYPDVVATLMEVIQPTVENCILDCEIVAIDEATGALQSFQQLQHRARKNVMASTVRIPVCVFAFDLLYLNGKSLLRESLRDRRRLLFEAVHFSTIPRKFQTVQYMNTTIPDDIHDFMNQSLVDGCEGLMIKTLVEDAQYVPSRRAHSWLKLKKDYMDGVVDTLDLVPIGAYIGKGKRTGVFGGFLLACYDRESDTYQSICKIGTGFRDSDLEQLTEQLKGHVHVGGPMSYYRYHEKDVPDVWLMDAVVWEVKAADLSISPRHYAATGLIVDGKGIALRFPRFVRCREDKHPTDATDSSQVAAMYRAQTQGQSSRMGESEKMFDDDEW